MEIRDRIKAFRRVPAGRLRPNPRTWRTHPPVQQEAMRGMLAEIGYADALLARELADGSLELVDGHLRAELTPDCEVPVLVLDLTAEESAKLLALHDPLAAMAETNRDVLAELVRDVETQNEALQHELERLGQTGDQSAAADLPDEVAVPELYQVVVECGDEDRQRDLFERLVGEGWKCRLLML